MKEYYTHDGQEQKGPMALEGLLSSGITGDSLIWHAGLEGWHAARELEEMKFFFAQETPVATEQEPPAVVQAPPPVEQVPLPPAAAAPRPSFGYIPPARKSATDTTRRNTIILLLVLAAIALVTFIVSIRSAEESVDAGQASYTDGKPSVAAYERAHPAEFLATSGSFNKALLGKKLSIYGTITNRATVTNFKDINIQLSYYSAAKRLISTDNFVLREMVPAHLTKTFTWKVRPPAGTANITWEAKGARAY